MKARGNSIPEISKADSQHFVLDHANWELYEQLLKTVGNRPIRIAYDHGMLEIMSTLWEHERPKKIIGRMIDLVMLECGVSLASYGSTTFRLRELKIGLEPDDGYYIQHAQQMRHRKRLNLHKDPAPDLVIEIDIVKRSIPREPIFAAMDVPEIWRWNDRRLQCVHLIDGVYRTRKRSRAFQFLEPAKLSSFIEMAYRDGETHALKAFVSWMRSMG